MEYVFKMVLVCVCMRLEMRNSCRLIMDDVRWILIGGKKTFWSVHLMDGKTNEKYSYRSLSNCRIIYFQGYYPFFDWSHVTLCVCNSSISIITRITRVRKVLVLSSSKSPIEMLYSIDPFDVKISLEFVFSRPHKL